MYKKTTVVMATVLAAIMAVGLTANHAFASNPPSNSGTNNVAVGGNGGIGGAGGAGGTAIGGYGACFACGGNGNANANGGHGGNANGGFAAVINGQEKTYP